MPTILIVDDDPQIRGWLRHVLEDKGYQVEEAGDGTEALACLGRMEPALIVLDLFMPNKDGAEILLYLQSRARPIKTLAISGQLIGGRDMTQTAIVLGAHDAIAKPFDAQTFLSHVGELLPHPS